MGDNNILPKGGFMRGILTGLILIFFLFVGLSVLYPLPIVIGPAPAAITELDSAPSIPLVESEESGVDVAALIESTTPIVLPQAPEQLSVAAPEASIDTSATAPIQSVSVLEPMPTSNDIQVGTSENALPVVTDLDTVTDSSNDIPQIDTETIVPDVTTELGDTELSNDNTSIVAPTDALELTGQTLIDQSNPETETPKINAFDTFAAEFTDDKIQPLMSIILHATTLTETQTVASLAAPLTLAVAADNPDAAEIITGYRALGGEVVLLLPTKGPNALRKGGDPVDAANRLNALMANTDGVIGILDGPDGDLNQDSRMLVSILAILSETGHAIITVDGLGTNRASVMANEAGIPAAGISHLIDTSEGTIAVVRELDKVVLQFGDRQSVTIFAPVTPDMLFGLNFWLESQKAQIITVAPVSASIRRY